MERAFHGTSHLGRCNIDGLIPAAPVRTSIDIRDLDTLANLVYVKLQIARFHGVEIQMIEYERQLTLIAETADMIA